MIYVNKSDKRTPLGIATEKERAELGIVEAENTSGETLRTEVHDLVSSLRKEVYLMSTRTEIYHLTSALQRQKNLVSALQRQKNLVSALQRQKNLVSGIKMEVSFNTTLLTEDITL